jgi:hypothetical protein
MNNDLASFDGNPAAQLILRAFPISQRLLIVTDGDLDFDEDGFGLSEFIGILQAAGHRVDTAHRRGKPPVTVPGPFDFATASPSVTTANYDQLWLFAFTTTALGGPEQAVIEEFMQSGGGVFATGDHATIGCGMGANIPRVRRMRDWRSVPFIAPGRLDTVVNPDPDGIRQLDDQADATPQRIYPTFFLTARDRRDPQSWTVHPLLRYPSGVVDVLPDHAHEGECLAPEPTPEVFLAHEEWPAATGKAARVAPELVAVSMSGGRFVTDFRYPPVQPRSFGAISAYDGHRAGIGRVVCDSTWHHFVNLNVNGKGATPDATNSGRTGLYVAGKPSLDYLKIRQYYLNTVHWLAPQQVRRLWPWVAAAAIRFDYEVRELQLPAPEPLSWDSLMHIGTVVEDAMTRHWGAGAPAEMVASMHFATERAPQLFRILNDPASSTEADIGDSLLPVPSLRRAVHASFVNRLARYLPPEARELTEVVERLSTEGMSAHLGEAVDSAQTAISGYLTSAVKATMATALALAAK